MDLMVLEKKVKDPEELRPYSCQGMRDAPVSYNSRNALHPLVQETWINAMGELADKLRDSPAFAGIAVRADVWQYNGHFALGSLYWGYSDWTIAQFEKDTGLTVPGKPGDPKRFMERFQFLTGEPVRDEWIRWRCDRTLDYHRRLRDRIRGDRKDVAFVISGDGRGDSTYGLPNDPYERFLGMGIDLERLKSEDGIAVMPMSRYGSRNTTSSEQAIYDGFLDPENKAAGFGRVRAFSNYMVYHEIGHAMPYDKLGVKTKGEYYYCSAVDGGGRHSLQKYAAVLADQDTAILRDGGNSYIFGDPDIWLPWFTEFNALPRKPFTPVPSAVDPVAIWLLDGGAGPSRKPEKSDLKESYFYAVNREQYPIKVTVKLAGTKSVVRLGTGETLDLPDGKLQLDLAPYELRSFRAPKGTAIASVQTDLPPERVLFVKRRLAFAQELADAITTGAFAGNISVAEREAYLKTLSAAWVAFGRGHLWRARTALSMAPMMVIYEKLGRMPDGQIVTRFPGLLSPKPDGYYIRGEAMLGGDDLAAMLPAGSKAQVEDSQIWNGEWGGGRVVRATEGVLELELETPAAGNYSLSIGHVADKAGVTTVSVNGQSLPLPIVTAAAGAPESLTFPQISVPAGKTRLTLRRDGAFGVYGVKWLPVMRPLPSELWSVVGPFKSAWGEGPGRLGFEAAGAKKGFRTVLPPETNSDLSAVYKGENGAELRWAQKNDSLRGIVDATGVDWAVRTASPGLDFNYAMTFISSPDERTVFLDIGVDWWANAWLNGERVKSNLQTATVEASGADFNSKRYCRAELHLKPGVNTLLIKTQGGSMGSSFSAYLTYAPDLKVGPTR